MWTDDEDNEPLWVDEPEPTPVERVTVFFEKYGADTVCSHDLGYDCHLDVSVAGLYEMFRLRYELEKEGHEF